MNLGITTSLVGIIFNIYEQTIPYKISIKTTEKILFNIKFNIHVDINILYHYKNLPFYNKNSLLK